MVYRFTVDVEASVIMVRQVVAAVAAVALGGIQLNTGAAAAAVAVLVAVVLARQVVKMAVLLSGFISAT